MLLRVKKKDGIYQDYPRPPLPTTCRQEIIRRKHHVLCRKRGNWYLTSIVEYEIRLRFHAKYGWGRGEVTYSKRLHSSQRLGFAVICAYQCVHSDVAAGKHINRNYFLKVVNVPERDRTVHAPCLWLHHYNNIFLLLFLDTLALFFISENIHSEYEYSSSYSTTVRSLLPSVYAHMLH